MPFAKKNKKLLIILSSAIVGIILLMLIAQLIIGNILEGKLNNSLSKKENRYYKTEVGNVKFNLFTMTLILKDLKVTPDSTLLAEVKSPTSNKNSAFKLDIPVIRIRNIGLFNLLLNKQINISKFLIKDADIHIYSLQQEKHSRSKAAESPKAFDTDSIVLPGISGVNIEEIVLASFSVEIINIINNDTVISAKNLDLSFNDIELIKNETTPASFKLLLTNANVKMFNERFNLPGGKYYLSASDINFNTVKKVLNLKNLIIKPRFSRSKMVAMSKFNNEIYNCEITSLEVHSFNMAKIINSGAFIVSKIIVDTMNLNIFKDKRLPFDTLKRPKLPMQQLHSLKQYLNIDSVFINNSKLVYSERHASMKQPMKVTLSNLNVKIANITSILDSMIAGRVLTIRLRANLQKSIPMGVNIYMPLVSTADTFSFNGWLGAGSMKLFNNILLPAIGIKFNGGYLNGVKFTASANGKYTIGKMTMLYRDLDGEVVQKNPEKSNKFLSWVANAAMIKNNPIQNKEKRVVPMYFNRVIYKGLGNFLWKTLQSGITATIIPTMENKVQRQIDRELGTDRNTNNKTKRTGKRKNRKKNRKK